MRHNGEQVGNLYEFQSAASDSYLDLNHAPYVLYGVKYIDLVSLVLFFRRTSR